MSRWPIVALSAICRPKQWPTLSMAEMKAKGFPVYGANGPIGFTDTFTHEEPTILVGCRGSCGSIHVTAPRSYANGNAMALDDLDKSRVEIRFVAHYLRNRGFRDVTTGTSQPQIIAQNISRVSIPLPPLPEQRRIAEILDKADALRAKRRAALAQLDILTQSIFLDMFGDPATNPKGSPVVSVADICAVRGGKRLPKGEEYSSVPTPFRYIRVMDLRAGRVDESALVYLKPEIQSEIARYVVNTGDVIISIAGSIGLVAPVPQSLDGVNLTENAAKLVPRSSGRYEAEYLARFLETDHAQGQIGSHIGQVTIGKLALFRIEKLKVPLPPIKLQREFVCQAAEVKAHGAAQKEACSRLDALFASLQHRAFRREL